MLPNIAEKLIIRMFNVLSQQKFYFTTSSVFRACSLQVQGPIAKKFGRGSFNLTTAMLLLLQLHGAEQEAKKRTSKMSQTLDRFFKKVSNHLQTKGIK